MEYDWEEDAKNYFASIDKGDVAAIHGGPYRVMALAIENVESGEAALILVDREQERDVIAADLWKDIWGDAMRRYDIALEYTFGEGKPN